MGASYELLLLGPAEVRCAGAPVQIRQREPRALLFYLGSKSGMVTREAIIDLFWEGLPAAEALEHLQRAETALQSSLPGPAVIVKDANFIGLDQANVKADQREFQNLLDQAGGAPWRDSPQSPLSPESYQLLSQAAGLWRGRRYLQDLTLPPAPRLLTWLRETARRMENLRGRILERLANHSFAIGDHQRALELSRQALENLRLDENVHLLVMQALLSLGRTEEARTHFESLQRKLQRELDTAPSPRLVDLYRQIRTGTIKHSQAVPAGSWKLRTSFQVPFTGRELILEKLNQSLKKGGGVLIIGEAGQGKTRLLQEFSRRLDPRLRLLVSTCRPAETNLPFQPIIEILRHHILPDEWLSLSASWAGQLTLLMPELAVMRPDLNQPLMEVTPELAPGHARSIIMEAIRQVFITLSRKHRLVFCLDDAHWSDEATLATITYLLEREPFRKDAFLVMAARQEEQSPHLASQVKTLLPSGSLDVIHLPQFSTAETAALAGHMLGTALSERLSQRLSEETGGNPLFILETLRLIKETTDLSDLETLTNFPITSSFQTLIRARLAKLSALAREVLEAAAVQGEEFDPKITAQMVNLGQDELQRALQELEQRQLIRAQAGGTGQNQTLYCLSHQYIREMLLQEINPLQKRLFHLRFARILADRLRTPVSETAAILAQHYEAAGEPALAFDQWVNAGRYARQLFSTTEAYSAFRQAESLIRTTPGLTDMQIHRLYAEWTETAYESEDPASIRRQNNFLLALGEQRHSAMLTGTALDGLSDACMAENQFETGLNYTRQAIRYLEKSDNLFEHMEAYNHQGVFLLMLNQIEAAGEAFQDALALGAHQDDPLILRSRANAHYHLSVTSTFKGWPQTAVLHAARSLEDFKTLNRAHGQVTSYSALALSNYFLGLFTPAAEACEQGLELAGKLQAGRMLGYLHLYRAMIRLSQGEVAPAWEDWLKAGDLGERYGHQEITAISLRLSGDLFLLLGDAEQAANVYLQALELSENLFIASDCRFRAGLALYLSGKTEAGLIAIEKSIQDADNSGSRLIHILARASLAFARRHEEDPEKLDQDIEEILEETSVRGLRFAYLWGLITRGDIYLRLQNYPAAREVFQTVAKEAGEIPIVWLELTALQALERIAALTGEQHPRQRERMEAILKRLDRAITQEPYRNAFLRLQERFRPPQ